MKLAAFMGDSVCPIGARCLEFACLSWRDFQHLFLEIHPVLFLALQLLQAAALVLDGLPRYLQKSEQEFLPGFLLNDIQLIVVAQGT